MKTICIFIYIVGSITYIICQETKCDKDEDCQHLCPEYFKGKCTIKCEQRSCTVQMVPRGPYIMVEKSNKCASNADCKCPKDIVETCTSRCNSEGKCSLEVTPRAPVLVMDDKQKCSNDAECECPIGEAVAECKPFCVGYMCSFSLKEKGGSDYNDIEEHHTCNKDDHCKHLCPEVFEGTCIPHCRENSCNLGLIPLYPVPNDFQKLKKRKRAIKCKSAKCGLENQREKERQKKRNMKCKSAKCWLENQKQKKKRGKKCKSRQCASKRKGKRN